MAPRLIITGSTGYIGARLAAMARERGFEVVELGRRSGAKWRIGDAPAASDLEGAVGIVHLAPPAGTKWRRKRRNAARRLPLRPPPMSPCRIY